MSHQLALEILILHQEKNVNNIYYCFICRLALFLRLFRFFLFENMFNRQPWKAYVMSRGAVILY